MSAMINISARPRPATSRRTRQIGQGGVIGTRVRRKGFIPRTFRAPKTVVIVQRPGEKKFFDQSLAVATTAAWAIISVSVCIPAQGTGIELRIGDSISVTSLNFRMYLSMNAVEAQAAPSPTILTRIIIGVSNRGQLAATTDVVDTGSTSDLLSYYQNSTIRDFTILKDFFVKVDPHALNEGVVNSFAHGTSISDVVKFTHTFKKPLQVRFGAASTNVTQNAFFIMAISSATGGTQNIECRTRYTDA